VRSLCPALLLLLVVAGVPARATADEARTERVARLVADLEDLARWCAGQKLFAERNATYEQILAFEPDHAEARRWLKYRRAKDGTWIRPGAYAAPRNFRAPPDELAARRARIGDTFADATLRWLEAQGRDLRPDHRAAAIREALVVAPEREDLRALAEESRATDGRWVLAETLRAATRRPALARAAQEALAAVPEPGEGRPTAAENDVPLPWTAGLQGRLVRVLGTTGRDEVAQAVRTAEACFALFGKAFPGEVPPIPGLTILLLRTGEERDTLLRTHPAADDAFRTWAADLSSGWLPGQNVVYGWSTTREGRMEWCARQPIGSLLRRRFGVRSKHGWAFEGFGLYLSHLVTGRRQTFFVRRTDYGEDGAPHGDLWDKLRSEGADWRREARRLLVSARAPDLRLLLGKDVNAMDTEDMLASYALAAFVLEGRGPQALAWLEAVGDDTPWEEALQVALGLDAETLRLRLRRWLEETAPER